MNNDSHRPVIHRLHRYPQFALRDFRNPLSDLLNQLLLTRRASNSRVLPPPVPIQTAQGLIYNQFTDGGLATKEQTEAGSLNPISCFATLAWTLAHLYHIPIDSFCAWRCFKTNPWTSLYLPIKSFVWWTPPPIKHARTNHLQCKSIFANFVCRFNRPIKWGGVSGGGIPDKLWQLS